MSDLAHKPIAPPAGDEIRAWEDAYRSFETPQEELQKFLKRLRSLGVDTWDRNLSVTELCCGRGNGLKAWHELGFRKLEGLDISERLARDYRGPARIVVGDARELPFATNSRDVLTVQGGLHHLPREADLDRTLGEIRRVLRPEGRFLLVEPWTTPFLRFVHFVTRRPLARKLSPKLDAFERMYELEKDTYDDWRHHPDHVMDVLTRHLNPTIRRIAWGKLMLVGTPTPEKTP